jgi:hypothetical protein
MLETCGSTGEGVRLPAGSKDPATADSPSRRCRNNWPEASPVQHRVLAGQLSGNTPPLAATRASPNPRRRDAASYAGSPPCKTG